MRNASRPNRPSVGTRSKKAMSSSIVIQRPNSRHELVAAGLGDQDGGAGGITLDFLPQPVNVRLERMGGDAGIVTPHFLQQHLARDRPLPGAIEIAQDRGFLLGEANLVALRVNQQLRAREERVWSDRE